MSTVMQAIQAAMFNLLNQDTELMQQVEAIYDHAPLSPQWPCVVLGTTSARDWSTKHRQGTQVLMELHVLCDQAGRATTIGIMDKIATLLKEQHLVAEDLQLIAKQVEQGELPVMEEDTPVQGTVRFRAFFEAA